jgi:hypothetical protein
MLEHCSDFTLKQKLNTKTVICLFLNSLQSPKMKKPVFEKQKKLTKAWHRHFRMNLRQHFVFSHCNDCITASKNGKKFHAIVLVVLPAPK